MPSIDTVVDDIYGLFDKEHEVNPDNIKVFAENIAEAVKGRLETIQKFDKPSLRVSKIGTPDRKLWYEMNLQNDEAELAKIDPETCIKFIYGDMIEELVLLLVKEAGHVVEGEQGEIDIDGVLGHRDCIIDGITTDVKSTSKFAFSKFSKGTLHTNDPFGYIAQISAYSKADGSPFGAFLAMNKETGELALLKIQDIDMINPEQRVKHVREMVSKPEPPVEKCYPDKPHGKSANRVVDMNCAYCPFMELCWADANNGRGIRKFRYSNGIVNFTHVENEPRVEEVIDSQN